VFAEFLEYTIQSKVIEVALKPMNDMDGYGDDYGDDYGGYGDEDDFD